MQTRVKFDEFGKVLIPMAKEFSLSQQNGDSSFHLRGIAFFILASDGGKLITTRLECALIFRCSVRHHGLVVLLVFEPLNQVVSAQFFVYFCCLVDQGSC